MEVKFQVCTKLWCGKLVESRFVSGNFPLVNLVLCEIVPYVSGRISPSLGFYSGHSTVHDLQ